MKALGWAGHKLLQALQLAAANEMPCPTNYEIATLVGYASIGSASMLLTDLERRGLIKVERFSTSRRVTIVASGASTFVPDTARPPAVAWSKRDRSGRQNRAGDPARCKAQRGQGAGRAAAAHDPVIDMAGVTLVDRDPCPRCGVRGDIDCGHRRARLAVLP